MKVKDIMIPCSGEKYIKCGINEDSSVHGLKIDRKFDDSSIVEVADDKGRKIGEVDKGLLIYLNGTTNTWIISNVVDSFEEAVVAIDPEGKIFYVNDAYSKILGVPIRKIIGKQIQKIEPEAKIMEVLKTKVPVAISKQYIKTLNKYVSVRIFPIVQGGKLEAVVSIFTDATEIVQLSEEVKRVNEVAISFQQAAEAQEQLSRLEIVGKSVSFTNAISQSLVVAKTEASVLIKGDNGVGKEVIAKLIHANSKRKDRPIITVNCAAIPESLIESELFGYEEGSFTGAKHGGKMGKFELANRGTLFLDEIGDMPITMQSKLLRVLQEGEIEKIGRQKNVPVDVRLITATNQPLGVMIKERKFRQDLYYRLNIVEINIPPLSERGEDVGLLAKHYLQKYNKKYEKSVYFSEEVFMFLNSYKWPGNVRELQNCIEYGVIMSLENCFNLNHLPPHMKESVGNVTIEKRNKLEYNYGTLKEAVEIYEKKIIIEAISACQNNKSKAMRLLGLSRRTFYRKLIEYEISNGEK